VAVPDGAGVIDDLGRLGRIGFNRRRELAMRLLRPADAFLLRR
jgi:hypothetical protein